MTNITPSKAIRVGINLGEIPLDVYQMPSLIYKMSGRNVTDAIDEPNNSLIRIHGVKSLKSLPHADSSLIQVKAVTGETFIPVSIEDAAFYWAEMAQRGNNKAKAILIACAVESIERRADHALGIMRSEEERNERSKLRMSRVLARYSWTDTLKQRCVDLYGNPPSADQYKQWTGNVNLILFKQWHFKCDRDTMTPEQQRTIEQFEFMCCRQASKNPKASPEQILDIALGTF